MSRIGELTKGKWEAIHSQLSPQLDDALRNMNSNDPHVECPVHGGKKPFRLFPDGSGGGVCSRCGTQSDGFRMLQWLHGWDFATAAKNIEDILPSLKDVKPKQQRKANPLPRLKALTQSSKPIDENDPVQNYLRGRMIGIERFPRELRCGIGVTYNPGDKKADQLRFDAMLATIERDGENLTYHITFIDGDKKADIESPKKIMTPIKKWTGGAVKLYRSGKKPNAICVAEGIETAIAAHHDCGCEAWAAISANGMENLDVPEWVRTVFIYGDNDFTYTGQKAAYTLANKLTLKGVDVAVVIPDTEGYDFLDEWNKTRAKDGAIQR